MITGHIKRRSNFSAIPNAMIRDGRLSIEARGMLALMMGMDADWKFRASHLMKTCGIKKDKYQRIIRELKEVGYLLVYPEQTKDGKFNGYVYEIMDDPGCGENRQPDNPPTVKTSDLRIPSSKNTNKKEPHTPKGDLFGDGDRTSQKETETEIDQSLFDRFWRNYPSSTRKTDKPKARKLFWKIVLGKHPDIKKTDASLIVSAAARYADDVDPKFIAMPTTWLNGARWENYQHKPTIPSPNEPNDWEERVR